MKIVFSIPVHERPESVLDMIENIFAFNDDCGVALHFSKPFDVTSSYISEKTFRDYLSKEPYASRVVFNKERYDTIRVKGGVHLILNAHCGNFDAACEKFGDFEYFMFMASNELYFKKGAYDFMKNYEAGVRLKPFEQWTQAFLAVEEPRLRRLMETLHVLGLQCGLSEGTFYKREIFKKIEELMLPHINPNLPPTGYALEEVVLPTIAAKVLEGKKFYKGGLTKANFAKNLEPKDVPNLLEQKIHYSFKRVSRDFNNPARKYIGTEVANYRSKIENLFYIVPKELNKNENKDLAPVIIPVSKVLSQLGQLIKAKDYLSDVDAVCLYTKICDDPQISTEVWKYFSEELFNLIRMTQRRLAVTPQNQLMAMLETAIYMKIAEIYKKFSDVDSLQRSQLADGIALATYTRAVKRFPPIEFERSAVTVAQNFSEHYNAKAEHKMALDILQKAQKLESGITKKFYSTLAETYHSLDRKEEAMQAYEKSF